MGIDKLIVGVGATAANALFGQTATSFAAALSNATSLVGSGARDIVVVNVTGTEAGTYVFVDNGGTNSVNIAIKLTGVLSLTTADFI